MRLFLALLVGVVLIFPGCASTGSRVTDERVLAVVGPTRWRPQLAARKPEVSIPPLMIGLAPYVRSAWAAGIPQPRRMRPMGKIYRLTVHHEGRDRPNELVSSKDVIACLRETCMSHRNYKGWSDIGYHFAIDRAGRMWECRSIRYQGAHVDSANQGNIGIEVLGNFDIQTPTRAQKQALAALVRKLCDKYGIPSSRVYTHRELGNTDCPGRNLQAYVDEMRRELKAAAKR